MENKKDYKDTLNIFNSSFDMKANLRTKEPLYHKHWEEKKIYDKALMKNSKQEPYILHDGPPYANGDLHVGHALNKILKDFIIRFKTMQGHNAPFVLGWDTHGLPIEHALLKNDSKIAQLSVLEFREKCKQYAMGQIEKQKKQFARLGLFTNYDDYYVTYDSKYELEQIKVFHKMIEKELVFRDLKPVYWSPTSQSALAEAEIEYKDKESNSVYVIFDFCKTNEFVKKGYKFIVWTTTPWTLPSNLAVAVNSEFEYCVVKNGDDHFVLNKKLYTTKLKDSFGWEHSKICSSFSGKELLHLTYENPLTKKHQPFLDADFVTDEDGTGIVHIAPGFGNDDYLVCKKYNIKPFSPINEYGKFTEEVDLDYLVGLFYEDANSVIIDKFKELNRLVKSSKFTHSYPHDWRTKKPVIYRATNQWFVNIEKIRKEILANNKKVSWFPEWGKERLDLMIKNRKEWCISRQRKWGVIIPIVYQDDKPMLDAKTQKHILNIFEKEGTDSWYKHEPEYFVPESQLSNNLKYRLETDIMDVWFDSGTSFQGVVNRLFKKTTADVYLEGNDQFRGWFNSSLICSTIMNDTAPYKNVIVHGMVVDKNGNKMSKSIGNIIEPLKVCDEYGADVLRLWVSLTNYRDESRIGPEILRQISDHYRKIRNTIRFLIANISDFETRDIYLNEFDSFSDENLYILNKFNKLIKKYNDNFEEFNFLEATTLILNFCSNDLSSFYLNFTKDTLYCDNKRSFKRQQIQEVFVYILTNLLKMIAPILPHTAEEAYESMSSSDVRSSIFLSDPIKITKLKLSKDFDAKWIRFSDLKDRVFKKIEEAREKGIIKKNTDISLVLHLEKEDSVLMSLDLKTLFMVSEVIFDNLSKHEIVIHKHKGEECARCGKMFHSLSNELCERCTDVIMVR